MDRTSLQRILRFTLLLIVQIVVLNHIHLLGYATPLLLGFAVLRFHYDTSRVGALLWGFTAGMVYDIFSNTMGMGMASMTLLAMAQPTLLGLFKPRDASDDFTPTLHSMGVALYLPYTFIGMLLLHLTFYMLEAFSTANLHLTLIAVIGGALLSTVIALFVEILLQSKKRD